MASLVPDGEQVAVCAEPLPPPPHAPTSTDTAVTHRTLRTPNLPISFDEPRLEWPASWPSPSISPHPSTTRTTCLTSGTPTTLWPRTSSPDTTGCAGTTCSTSPGRTSTG